MVINFMNYGEVMALVPMYGENGGNFTQVWFTNGKQEMSHYCVDTVVTQMGRLLAVDLRQLRRNVTEVNGRSRLTPLIMRKDELWLAPMFMRNEIRAVNDGAIGYVTFQHIADFQINGDPKCTTIIFDNGQKLTINQRTFSVNQTLMLTKMVGETAI